MITRGNEVVEILGGYRYPELESYVVFEDGWILEDDKVLYDCEGNVYNVLAYTTIDKEFCIGSSIYTLRWFTRKCSCVKTDRAVRVGDILYTRLVTNDGE